MKNYHKKVSAIILVFGTFVVPALAQQAPASPPAAKPWSANCVSEGRKGNLECLMQQRVVMSNTGQQLAMMTLRLPAGGSVKPILAVQVPFGINLPDGLKLATDDVTLETLAFRTCDSSGCYAEGVLQDKTLASLRKAESVNVIVKDLSGREVKVPVSLLGFSEAYDKIR